MNIKLSLLWYTVHVHIHWSEQTCQVICSLCDLTLFHLLQPILIRLAAANLKDKQLQKDK